MWVAPKEMAFSKSALMPIERPLEAVTFRHLCQQCEMQACFLINRRNAHQSGQWQVEGAHLGHEGVHIRLECSPLSEVPPRC
jgi:hypothetical protein